MGPDRQHEVVQCGPNLAPLLPTAYLKVDPWGHLWQWHEATAEGFGGCINIVGKWLKVQQE